MKQHEPFRAGRFVSRKTALAGGIFLAIALLAGFIGMALAVSETDTTPPVVTSIQPSPNSYINDATPTIIVDYTDDSSGVNPASVYVYLDYPVQPTYNITNKCTISDTEATCQTNTITSGKHKITVGMSDNAGNAMAPYTSTFTYSTSAPKVTSVKPSGNINTTATNIVVTFSTGPNDAPVDMSSIVLYLDSAKLPQEGTTCTTVPNQISCPVSGLTTGSHVISGSVKNQAGITASINGAFSLDITPPSISDAAPSGLIEGDSTTITAHYSDIGSGIDTTQTGVSLDGNWMHADCVITATSISCPSGAGLSQGTHYYRITVTDNAGNIAKLDGTFTVDTVPPYIWNISPSGNISSSSAVVYAYIDEYGSGLDSASVHMYLDGSEISGCQLAGNVASCNVYGLAMGDHAIGVAAADNAGNTASATGTFSYNDTAPPVISNIKPSGSIASSSATVYADYTDSGSGIDSGSVVIKLDGNTLTGCTIGASKASCNVYGLSNGGHSISVSVSDKAGNKSTATGSFSVGVDNTPPTISNIQPAGNINTSKATISAYFSDSGSGINSASVKVKLDGSELSGCAVTSSSASCNAYGLVLGTHTIDVSVADNAGNTGTGSGSFTYIEGRNYFWPWYDNRTMEDWVLLANPVGGSPLSYSLSIGGAPQQLGDTGYGAGVVTGGKSLTPRYNDLMDGPVKATSATGAAGIVSQRSLLGNSLEEVPGIDEANLSSHYYWTWYDEVTPGMTDWILVANTAAGDTYGAGDDVYYQITIAGNKEPAGAGGSGVLKPGQRTTPRFPNVKGGPVEVQAWVSETDGSGNQKMATPAKILASQRVLSNFGGAFNEVPGTPAESLSNDYLWTWYDQQSAGAIDWVLVANPSASSDVYYRIKIGSTVVQNATKLGHGKIDTPTFPGRMDGLVEVDAAADQYFSTPANVITSQRTLWGPSFEEVPGMPKGSLGNDYHWTWYDELSSGSLNWILVANPGDSAVNIKVTIGGVQQSCGSCSVPAHGRVYLRYPGTMAGPVEVQGIGGKIMTSQRVLWNGYFNEVLGTVLN